MTSFTVDDNMINFVRNAWRTHFKNHTVAPLTLCFDPLSTISGTIYGLAHIAHDYLYPDSEPYVDPDSQIYAIDPIDQESLPGNPSSLTVDEIGGLPMLECIVFVSSDTTSHKNEVLKKLVTNGLVVVINECIELPDSWLKLDIDLNPMYGATKNYIPGLQETAPLVEPLLYDIQAFVKPEGANSEIA